MRLSISNIAWNPEDDETVAALLKKYNVDAIDIAPGKYFPDPKNATTSDILKVKSIWHDRGFDIVGMQALLFGTTGLNVFKDNALMLSHLKSICKIGSTLGANKLVFGSPKNRDRTGLSDSEVLAIAIPFFNTLGDICSDNGIIMCLEPNPTEYGANFMTNTLDTAFIVNLVNHKSIKMQLDTGAMFMNKEHITDLIDVYQNIIGHIHISEPQLAPINSDNILHDETALALKQYFPKDIYTIEMLSKDISSIESSLKFTINKYLN